MCRVPAKLAPLLEALGGSKIVQNSHDYEEQLISAAKQFATSINSKSKVFSDISVLVDATNKLPLSGLDYWERLILTYPPNLTSDRFNALLPPYYILHW